MNRERIQQLRDHIASLPDEKFDMRLLVGVEGCSSYEPYDEAVDPEAPITNALHECGTAACIAGHAVALFEPLTPVSSTSAIQAAALLGLNWHTGARELFMPEGYEDAGLYNRKDAIRTLDRLLETGTVNWNP